MAEPIQSALSRSLASVVSRWLRARILPNPASRPNLLPSVISSSFLTAQTPDLGTNHRRPRPAVVRVIVLVIVIECILSITLTRTSTI